MNQTRKVNLFISLQNVSNDSFPESDRATKRSLPRVYRTEKEKELNKIQCWQMKTAKKKQLS